MPLTRRRAAALGLIAGPLCFLVSQALIPAGANGFDAAVASQAVRTHAAAWTAATLLNWALLTLMLPGFVALLGYLRHRGATLGMVGAVLIGAGTALSGFGLAENAGELVAAGDPQPAVARRAFDALAASVPGTAFDALTWLAIIGVLLALIGAVRGRLVGWWVPVLWPVGVVAYVVGDQLLSGVPLALASVPFALAPVLLGRALLRADGVSPTLPQSRRAARDRVTAAA